MTVQSVSDPLAGLTPPANAFGSDNYAGTHPDVIQALADANKGHVPAYGDDIYTRQCEQAFRDLFGAPIEVSLVFGGTGANVVALHTLCTSDSIVVCTEDAHMILDEAGAPQHITGAQIEGYPSNAEGKLTTDHVLDAFGRLGRVHIRDTVWAPHVVSITQATELGTVYTPREITTLCDAAHSHDMRVHVDGARITNALAAWGYRPETFEQGCRALAATGVDVVTFGGTKAGLIDVEAVLFLNASLAEHVHQRRKQAGQTASKMRFLAAQFLAGLHEGAMLDWSIRANEMAHYLASQLQQTVGVTPVYPNDANSVYVILPAQAIAMLAVWTHFYVWDPERNLARFMTSWDTTRADVDALVTGIKVAVDATSGTEGATSTQTGPIPSRQLEPATI